MPEDLDGKSEDQLIEEMYLTIEKLQKNSLWLKIRSQSKYEEFILALDSAEFYLKHGAMKEANAEFQKAKDII